MVRMRKARDVNGRRAMEMRYALVKKKRSGVGSD